MPWLFPGDCGTTPGPLRCLGAGRPTSLSTPPKPGGAAPRFPQAGAFPCLESQLLACMWRVDNDEVLLPHVRGQVLCDSLRFSRREALARLLFQLRRPCAGASIVLLASWGYLNRTDTPRSPEANLRPSQLHRNCFHDDALWRAARSLSCSNSCDIEVQRALSRLRSREMHSIVLFSGY